MPLRVILILAMSSLFILLKKEKCSRWYLHSSIGSTCSGLLFLMLVKWPRWWWAGDTMMSMVMVVVITKRIRPIRLLPSVIILVLHPLMLQSIFVHSFVKSVVNQVMVPLDVDNSVITLINNRIFLQPSLLLICIQPSMISHVVKSQDTGATNQLTTDSNNMVRRNG